MLFHEHLAFALATGCTLEINTTLSDARTKDSAPGPDKEFDHIEWTASVEGLVGVSNDSQSLYTDLRAAQLSGEKVTISIGHVSRGDEEIPTSGWELDNADEVLPPVTGLAFITNTSLNAPVDGNATCSIKLEGAGPLS